MWRPRKLTPEQLEERRLEAGRLLRAGRLSQAEIARRLGVSRMAVSQWAERLRSCPGGFATLKRRPNPGRPPRLRPRQWQQLLGILDKGAMRSGFETERWTLPRVRAVIERRFGVTYHASYLSVRLRDLGWTAQVPAVRARERDEELIRAWLDRDWPRIQKKARHKGAVIVFIDETGFSFQVGTDTTWAPEGRTPVLRRVSERRQVSTAIGLTTSGRVCKKHFDPAIHGEDTVAPLEHLRHQVPGAMIIIWDRLQAHRSAVVKAFLAEHAEIDVGWLPAYAPELNPEEECHGNVKQRTRNATPETEAEIRVQADRGFARLRRRPDILLSFFHHAGLRVKRFT
jgi:transposase